MTVLQKALHAREISARATDIWFLTYETERHALYVARVRLRRDKTGDYAMETIETRDVTSYLQVAPDGAGQRQLAVALRSLFEDAED
jgi:hypothetical protein